VNALYENIPIAHIELWEVNTAITKRAIELSVLKWKEPPVRFAWLNIGQEEVIIDRSRQRSGFECSCGGMMRLKNILFI
jgi:hypothetical protein